MPSASTTRAGTVNDGAPTSVRTPRESRDTARRSRWCGHQPRSIARRPRCRAAALPDDEPPRQGRRATRDAPLPGRDGRPVLRPPRARSLVAERPRANASQRFSIWPSLNAHRTTVRAARASSTARTAPSWPSRPPAASGQPVSACTRGPPIVLRRGHLGLHVAAELQSMQCRVKRTLAGVETDRATSGECGSRCPSRGWGRGRGSSDEQVKRALQQVGSRHQPSQPPRGHSGPDTYRRSRGENR